MKKLLFFLFLLPTLVWSQKTAILKGIVKDKFNNPIENVSIKYDDVGTSTNKNGAYSIRIPLKKMVNILFTHVSYKDLNKEIEANSVNTYRFSPIMTLKTERLSEIVVKNNKKAAQGITTIDIKK